MESAGLHWLRREIPGWLNRMLPESRETVFF